MDKVKEEIENNVGIESYPKTKAGGQTCGIAIKGVRLWYPKHFLDNPEIDIRIQTERGQYRNKRIAETLIELVLEGSV